MRPSGRTAAVLAGVFGLWGAAATTGCGGGDAPAEPAPAMEILAAEAPNARDLLAAGHTLDVPSFSLTDQTGAPFGSAQLDGRVWVANLTSTRCGDVCPEVTAELRAVQEALQGSSALNDVRLVSVSVDAEHDTPQVLAAHANETGADQDRWKFLTGRPNQIRQLSTHGFRLPIDEHAAGAEPAFPRQEVLLVGRDRRIRGVFDGSSPDDRASLVAELRALAEAPAQQRYADPEEVLDPPWLRQREQDQLATVDRFRVFYDFQFEDRVHESGITFLNRVTDDSGKATSRSITTTGTGLRSPTWTATGA